MKAASGLDYRDLARRRLPSRRTRTLVWLGIGALIGSTIIIGLGNFFATAPAAA